LISPKISVLRQSQAILLCFLRKVLVKTTPHPMTLYASPPWSGASLVVDSLFSTNNHFCCCELLGTFRPQPSYDPLENWRRRPPAVLSLPSTCGHPRSHASALRNCRLKPSEFFLWLIKVFHSPYTFQAGTHYESPTQVRARRAPPFCLVLLQITLRGSPHWSLSQA